MSGIAASKQNFDGENKVYFIFSLKFGTGKAFYCQETKAWI